jgi:hypothetical protein
VEADNIQASFERGVLEVRMPKPAERKPTRIEIQGGSREKEPELVGAGS